MTVTSSHRRKKRRSKKKLNPLVTTIQFDAPKEFHECVKGQKLWNFIDATGRKNLLCKKEKEKKLIKFYFRYDCLGWHEKMNMVRTARQVCLRSG